MDVYTSDVSSANATPSGEILAPTRARGERGGTAREVFPSRPDKITCAPGSRGGGGSLQIKIALNVARWRVPRIIDVQRLWPGL